MESSLTDKQATRIEELLEVMSDRRSIIDATLLGYAEFSKALDECGEFQCAVLALSIVCRRVGSPAMEEWHRPVVCVASSVADENQ